MFADEGFTKSAKVDYVYNNDDKTAEVLTLFLRTVLEFEIEHDIEIHNFSKPEPFPLFSALKKDNEQN
jgi:hypothetical protein